MVALLPNPMGSTHRDHLIEESNMSLTLKEKSFYRSKWMKYFILPTILVLIFLSLAYKPVDPATIHQRLEKIIEICRDSGKFSYKDENFHCQPLTEIP